jgi:WD40 repeat protein
VVVTTGRVTAWDAMTGEKLGEHGVAPGTPSVNVAFGDHETLVAITRDISLEFLWDTATGKAYTVDLETDGHPAIAASGGYIAGIGPNQGGLKVVRLPDLTVETRIPKKCGTVVTFTADGRHLLCAGGGVTKWDLTTGRKAATHIWRQATATEEAADGAMPRAGHSGALLVGVEDDMIRAWDTATDRQALIYRTESASEDVWLDPSGKIIRYLRDDTVVSLDLGSRMSTTTFPDGSVALAISSDARLVVAAKDGSGQDSRATAGSWPPARWGRCWRSAAPTGPSRSGTTSGEPHSRPCCAASAT